jgi:hypothetical protein
MRSYLGRDKQPPRRRQTSPLQLGSDREGGQRGAAMSEERERTVQVGLQLRYCLLGIVLEGSEMRFAQPVLPTWRLYRTDFRWAHSRRPTRVHRGADAGIRETEESAGRSCAGAVKQPLSADATGLERHAVSPLVLWPITGHVDHARSRLGRRAVTDAFGPVARGDARIFNFRTLVRSSGRVSTFAQRPHASQAIFYLRPELFVQLCLRRVRDVGAQAGMGSFLPL